MLSIKWTDKFSIGVAEVDAQHQKLFGLIEKLNESVKTSNEVRYLVNYLDELIDYTKYHFQSEEKIMAEKDYPKYKMHKLEHEKLTQQAADFRNSVSEGKNIETDKFIEFLFIWLTKHIMDQDKKIGTFLQII